MAKRWVDFQAAMDRFETDRLVALRSLDEAQIRAYCEKYDARFPGQNNPEVFWAAVHKARTALPGLTEEEKAVSRAWLAARGLQPGRPL